MVKEVTLIDRLTEREIPQKFRNSISILDALLQFSQNPTSASAGYGIEENYPYIKNNLKKKYELSSEELTKIIQFIGRILKMQRVNSFLFPPLLSSILNFFLLF